MVLLKLIFALASVADALRVIQADIWKPDNGTLLAKRQEDPFSALLTQAPDKSLYWINITMGTPGQPQSLQLDTGSRQLWVPATGSSLCSDTAVDCSGLGSFDKSKSSTFSDTGQSQTIGFLDGDSVTGNWFYDTVHVGGEAITSQLAVLATTGTGATEGVLGIGFPASYPTINHNMAAQDLIASNSYSLWLDSLDSSTGTILFGGLNTAKFSGTLKKIPVLGTGDGSSTFNDPIVELTRVATLNGNTRTVQTASGFSQQAYLDSGTPLTILQKPLADIIMAVMGASYYPAGSTNGNTIIPCSQANSALSINYHFSNTVTGPTINVPISELVLQTLGSLNGVQMCQFGIYVSENNAFPTIMGDTFLRSAYVVYNLDKNRIGLAQTVFNSGPANILEIGPAGIPVGVVV